MNLEKIKTVSNKAIEAGKKLIPEFFKGKLERPTSALDAHQKIEGRINAIQQSDSATEQQITKLGGSSAELNQRTAAVDGKLGNLKKKFIEMVGNMPVAQHDGGIRPTTEKPNDPLKLNQTNKEFINEMDAQLNQPGAKQVLQVAEKIGTAPPGASKVGDVVKKAKNMFEGK